MWRSLQKSLANMDKSLLSRILFDAFGILTIAYGPWWLIATVILTGSFYFKKYYEGIIFGIITDTVYGTQGFLMGATIRYTVFSVIVFAFAGPLKRRLRSNR